MHIESSWLTLISNIGWTPAQFFHLSAMNILDHYCNQLNQWSPHIILVITSQIIISNWYFNINFPIPIIIDTDKIQSVIKMASSGKMIRENLICLYTGFTGVNSIFHHLTKITLFRSTVSPLIVKVVHVYLYIDKKGFVR